MSCLLAHAPTKKRTKKQEALKSATERFLADLLQAQASEKAKGYVFRQMRPESFTECDVSYRVFKALVDALVDLALLEKYKGFQTWGAPFGARVPLIRKATRFRATPALLEIIDQHEICAADFHQHFLIPPPEKPLQLRAASKRNEFGEKISGKLMKFDHTATTRNLEDNLKALNAFLEKFELRGGIHRGFIRVFNNGDHPQFNWNMGGRLYSYGDYKSSAIEWRRTAANDNQR